eukprot:COSAG06_NODE_182_length_20899_cov_89.175048_1_plen_305_part_00
MCVSLLLIRVLQPGDRHALRGPWRYKDSVNLPLRGHCYGLTSCVLRRVAEPRHSIGLWRARGARTLLLPSSGGTPRDRRRGGLGVSQATCPRSRPRCSASLCLRRQHLPHRHLRLLQHGGGASSRRLLFSDALFGLLIGLLFGILVLFSDALFILSELGILPLLLAAALDRHHALRLLHHADGGPVSFSWPGSLAFTACSVSSRRPVRFLRDGCLPAATATHATASRRRRWLRAFVPTPLAGLRHPLSEQGCARINVSRAISANLWAAAKLPRVPLAPACPSIARTVLWGWGRVPMLTASYARH